MLSWITMSALRERLVPLLTESEGGVVVFDADGTLWHHDVGQIVFEHAVKEGALREEGLDGLARAAERLGVLLPAGPRLGTTLSRAFAGGAFDERTAAEMQVWAYAGLTEAEFRELTRSALELGGHGDGLHEDVVELAEWVRLQGGESLIVSASPLWVVQEAVQGLGFAPEEVAAGVPLLSNDPSPRIACGLAAPLPYGPDKVLAGRQLLKGRRWCAALGDSSFDLDMFREAQLAIGIGDKADMLTGLTALDHGFRLERAPALR